MTGQWAGPRDGSWPQSNGHDWQCRPENPKKPWKVLAVVLAAVGTLSLLVCVGVGVLVFRKATGHDPCGAPGPAAVEGGNRIESEKLRISLLVPPGYTQVDASADERPAGSGSKALRLEKPSKNAPLLPGQIDVSKEEGWYAKSPADSVAFERGVRDSLGETKQIVDSQEGSWESDGMRGAWLQYGMGNQPSSSGTGSKPLVFYNGYVGCGGSFWHVEASSLGGDGIPVDAHQVARSIKRFGAQ